MSLRCRCQRCTVRGLMGPAILITIGVLFLIHQSSSSWNYGFHKTWPVIILVIGAIKLAESLSSTEGHGIPPGPGPQQGQMQPPQPPPPPPPVG